MNNYFSDKIIVESEILKIPSEEDIIITQKKLSFKLPPSYLDFVRKFGWGILCNFFLISIPSSTYSSYDLIGRSNDRKRIISDGFKMNLWDTSKLSSEKAENLFVFGDSENGDLLCWDLKNVNENWEFPIWFLGNENEVLGQVANDLYDFVNSFCVNQKIDTCYPVGQNLKWNLPPAFKPLM